MAPKTAKVKKAAEEKIIEDDIPKKGRGRVKVNVDKVDPVVEDNEEETKTIKRSKKILEEANVVDTNGTTIKQGRKKKVEEPVQDEKPSKKKTKAEIAKDMKGENGEDIDMLDYKKQNKKTKSNPKPKLAKGNTKNKNTNDADVLNDDDEDMKDENSQDIAEEETLEKVKPIKGRGRKVVKTAVKATEDTGEKEDGSSPEEEKEDDPQPKKSKGRKPIKKGSSEQGDIMEEIEQKAPKKTKVAKKERSVETNDVEEKAAKRTKVTKKEVKEKEETEDDIEMEENVEPKKTKGRKPKKPVESNVDDETEDSGEPTTKRARKATAEKEETEDDIEMEENVEPKKTKGRKPKKPVESNVDDETGDSGEPTTKRARKATAEKAPIDVKIKAPVKNKTATSYDNIDFTNASESPKGKPWNFKISNWNVDGIRAWLSKGGLDYIKYERPNILCIQETKCAQSKLPEEVKSIPGYHAYWLSSEKDGYAGVAVYTKELAINVEYGLQDEQLDDEGRIITAEYEQFYLICTYVPNSSRKLVNLPKRLKWNEVFRNYIKELDQKKPVIICGDMNVAHNEIDLKNPKTNRKNAGFTDEERAGMTELLNEGFIDTFRHLNPDKSDAYTFWTYMGNSRAKNVGWRLDYFIISKKLLPSLCDSVIRNEVYGSDHCPISLFLHLTSVERPKE